MEQKKPNSYDKTYQKQGPPQHLEKKEGIRSLQEAAILTQSTDFSENRIQSLEQKRILSLQSNQQQIPSSIYSLQQQNTGPQYAPQPLINQNTSSSLQNQNILTYGYG